MTTRSLPAGAGMDYFRKQARSLLRALRAGNSEAAQRVRPVFSDFSNIGLQNIQLVIAREYGFASWTRLKLHIERPGRVSTQRQDAADRFLSLACVSYFSDIAADPARYEAAGRLLRDDPRIAGMSIHTAAAAGDAQAVSAFATSDPGSVNRRGGVHGWTPLLYAAYSRVPDHSSLEAARVLLRHGANANDFFLDDGQYRFTALTGVFGEGEAGRERQPRHPDCEAFATMLLEAGADANDSQALYNRMFEPDDGCLTLLLRYGLSASDRNNWRVRENGQLVENTQTVFDYQLAWALEKGFSDRVRLLVQHGADVNSPIHGRTPYEWAMLGNNPSLAEFLVGQGAVARSIRPEDRLYARIMDISTPFDGGDVTESEIAALQAAHPAMMHEAAGGGDIEAVRRMLELGLDPNRVANGRTALHEAALHGDIGMAELLCANGADTAIRDSHYYAPAIGWAEYNGRTDMLAWLKDRPMDIFAAAAWDRTALVKALLDATPSLLDTRFGDFRGGGKPSPDMDWMTPLGFAINRKSYSTIRLLLARGASLSVRDASGRLLRDLARESGDDHLPDLIEQFARS